VILDELRKEAETFRLPILVVGVRDGFFVLLSVEGTDTTTGDCGELLPGESGGSFSAITTPSLLASKTNNKTEKVTTDQYKSHSSAKSQNYINNG